MLRTPAASASPAWSAASSIESTSTPVTRWAGAMPAPTNRETTVLRSPLPREHPSPVVPKRVTLSQPFARQRRAWPIMASISTAPPAAKGVVKAAERPNVWDKGPTSKVTAHW
jgi:hypothetical protein